MLTMTAGSMFVQEGLAASSVAGATMITSSPFLLGSLFAAGVYLIGRQLFGNDGNGLEQMIDYLKRIELSLSFDPIGGQPSLSVCIAPSTKSEAKGPTKEEQLTTVTESKNGNTTIYHIQNLNLYLNADMVQQMNVNPKEVINALDKALSKQRSGDGFLQGVPDWSAAQKMNRDELKRHMELLQSLIDDELRTNKTNDRQQTTRG